ncbi:MAG: Omp28-related outer membrane protein [Bacteroidia bacterium]|nr:Omp28-related outer membrane protein [Bacteroidia bacterium]
MKNLFKSSLAILVGLSLTMSACKKEDSTTDENSNNNNNNNNNPLVIPQVQKATVFYFGGTWCPPCGAYGKPAKEQLKAQVKSKCSILSCQVFNSDPMICAAGDELVGMFAPSGVPAMYIGANDDVITAMIGGSTATGSTAIGHVNTQSAKKAKVSVVLSHTTTTDGLINVTINGKFFEDLTSEYFISGYLLEDKLNYTQSNDLSTEKNVHYNVMRAKYGTSVTGELIKAAPKKDETFKKEMAFFIQPTFKKENLSIVVVIWKKGTDGKLTISNSENFHLN